MSIDDICPQAPGLRHLSIEALTALRDQVVAEIASRRNVVAFPVGVGRFARVGKPYRRADGALVVDCVAHHATGDREDER